MIVHAPTEAVRSVGIAMESELIDLLDHIRHALGDDEPPSRSEIARQILWFGCHVIQSRDPRVADLLRACMDAQASEDSTSASI